MARQTHKLTLAKIRSAPSKGTLSDGGGLLLVCTPPDGKSWVFRFHSEKKERRIGLGSFPTVSLDDARKKAAKQRLDIESGQVPPSRRQKSTGGYDGEATVIGGLAPTFGDCADAYVKSDNVAALKNAKHRAQWGSTLKTYCKAIWTRPVATITTQDVLDCLEPIWIKKQETARRLRSRIQKVIGYAKTKGDFTGQNPAVMEDNLDGVLSRRRKKPRHHPSMPYADLPAFVQLLLESPSGSSRALLWTILTAARTGDTIGATWREIDMQEQVWTVPADRMKREREHRVPLSSAAMTLLREIGQGEPDEAVFKSKADKALSNMAMLQLMRGMKAAGDATPHGMRATFATWAAENGWPKDIYDTSLAHIDRDKVHRAYQRGDLFERRRTLMEAWASHVMPVITVDITAEALTASSASAT